MNTSTLIVLLIVIVIAAFAIKNSIGHFKGEGGCCGGGETILPDEKQLTGQKIGEKTVHIEGMHCENCKNRVERAISDRKKGIKSCGMNCPGCTGSCSNMEIPERFRAKKGKK